MKQATATEVKTNFGKYLGLALREDVHITKNGTDVAILTAPKPLRSWTNELRKIIAEGRASSPASSRSENNDAEYKDAIAAEIMEKYESLN